MLLHLGLPSTVSAGTTDPKQLIPRPGMRKAIRSRWWHRPVRMINLSVGMLGSTGRLHPNDGDRQRDLRRSCAVSAVLMSGQASWIWMRWNVSSPAWPFPRRSKDAGPGGQNMSILCSVTAAALTGQMQAAPISGTGPGCVKRISATEPEHLPMDIEDKIRERFSIHLPRQGSRL